MELPHYEALYTKYKDQGLRVIAIEAGGDRISALRYLEDKTFSFPFLEGTREMVQEDYRVLSAPSAYFLDRNQHIVERLSSDSAVSEKKLEELIISLLAE